MQHYSVEMYIPTDRLADFLRDVGGMLAPDGEVTVTTPDGQRVALHGNVDETVVLKAGDESPWIGVIVRFPEDVPLREYGRTEEEDRVTKGYARHQPPVGMVEVGYIYLWIIPRERWAAVEFIACWRGMDRLFEESKELHRTFLALHDRHRGGGAILNRGDTPPCTCVRLDDVSGPPVGSPREHVAENQTDDDADFHDYEFDVERWHTAIGGWKRD